MTWQLEKQYFDLQTPDGRLLIGYRAAFGRSLWRVGYGACLRKEPGRPAETRQSLHTGAMVRTDDGAEWRNSALDLTGRWEVRRDPAPELTLDHPEGQIRWRVGGAAVPARIDIADGQPLTGIGYWETLTMTLAPWRLPFPELRWGRFLADNGRDYLIWVGWLGGEKEEKSLWSESGRTPGPPVFAEEGLRYQGGRLNFLSSEVIRSGPLFKSLAGRGGRLAGLLPGGLGRALEHKWFSRARRLDADGRSLDGWAVHEVVYWR